MQNQFHALQDWTLDVLEDIRKDIKTDHLASNPSFYRTYFGNRPQNRLTSTEIFAAYQKELAQDNQALAEWVVNRWVFKHADLYQHFAEKLSEINPEFDQISELSEEESERVLAGSTENFGAIAVFLLCLLNGVVFPKTVLERLRKEAEAEKQALQKKEETNAEQQSMEKIIASYKREIARQNEKILGVQKKYDRDTEALKKQIKILQQKLH